MIDILFQLHGYFVGILGAMSNWIIIYNITFYPVNNAICFQDSTQSIAAEGNGFAWRAVIPPDILKCIRMNKRKSKQRL
jgi:hypothetical protein